MVTTDQWREFRTVIIRALLMIVRHGRVGGRGWPLI